MQKRILSIFGACAFTVALVGCGSSDATQPDAAKALAGSTQSTQMMSLKVDTAALLPACDADREGALAYAVAEKSFFACASGDWQTVDISGDKGDRGEKGVDGSQGAKGDKGDRGDKGSDGTNGVDGLNGTNGTNGVDGSNGTNGADGLQGVQGERGLQGIQGIQGERGTDGTNGLNGTDGLQGERGIQGEQGLQGVQGERGLQGIQGTQGIQGVAGERGLQGIQGVAGVDGADGSQGERGLQGIQGEQGIQGVAGTQGIQGERGIQGIQGERGEQGIQGIQGIQGVAGTNGTNGVNGTNGTNGNSLSITEQVTCTVSVQTRAQFLRQPSGWATWGSGAPWTPNNNVFGIITAKFYKFSNGLVFGTLALEGAPNTSTYKSSRVLSEGWGATASKALAGSDEFYGPVTVTLTDTMLDIQAGDYQTTQTHDYSQTGVTAYGYWWHVAPASVCTTTATPVLN